MTPNTSIPTSGPLTATLDPAHPCKRCPTFSREVLSLCIFGYAKAGSMALILRSRKPAILDSVRTRQKLSPVRVATGPSPLEILAGSQRLSILEHADQELKELCSSIDSADKRRECFEASSAAILDHGSPHIALKKRTALVYLLGTLRYPVPLIGHKGSAHTVMLPMICECICCCCRYTTTIATTAAKRYLAALRS